MMLLAMIVGLWPDWAPMSAKSLPMESKLPDQLFPSNATYFLPDLYPVRWYHSGDVFVKYVVKDNISEGVVTQCYMPCRVKTRALPPTMLDFGRAVRRRSDSAVLVGPEALDCVPDGAAIGSNISRLAHLNYKNTHTPVALLRSRGGPAAIFKAPITGVLFLE